MKPPTGHDRAGGGRATMASPSDSRLPAISALDRGAAWIEREGEKIRAARRKDVRGGRAGGGRTVVRPGHVRPGM